MKTENVEVSEKVIIRANRDDDFVSDCTPCGNPINKVYTMVESVKHLNSDDPTDFVVELVPKLLKEENLDKIIQANAEGCDLKSIIANFLRTGDDSMLHATPVQTSFVDTTQIPKNPIEANNLIIKARSVNKEDQDALISMTKEELMKYVDEVVSKQVGGIKKDVVPQVAAPGESKAPIVEEAQKGE